MKKFFWLLIAFILVLPLMGASCISVKSDKPETPKDAGVFVSLDKGKQWEHKTYVDFLNDEEVNISGVNIMEMFFDPQDSQTIYLATEGNGVYVTYNGGEKWDVLYQDDPRAYEIVVDPNSRNVIYMSLGRQILKSKDGGENWDEIYFEAIESVIVETIDIDHDNPSTIYLGLSDGRLLRTYNGGRTWNRLHEFPTNVRKVLVNPNDGDIIYVATDRNGVFRSGNGGGVWHNISLGDDEEDEDRLKEEYPGIEKFKIMIFDQTQNDAIIIGTDYGLLKNKNGEADWEAIRLLTLPQEVDVVSLSLNPSNNKELYYGINNALYFSQDGGLNWAARSLPTSGMAQYLLVDPEDTSRVYLGVYVVPPPEEKKGLLRS